MSYRYHWKQDHPDFPNIYHLSVDYDGSIVYRFNENFDTGRITYSTFRLAN